MQFCTTIFLYCCVWCVCMHVRVCVCVCVRLWSAAVLEWRCLVAGFPQSVSMLSLPLCNNCSDVVVVVRMHRVLCIDNFGLSLFPLWTHNVCILMYAFSFLQNRFVCSPLFNGLSAAFTKWHLHGRRLSEARGAKPPWARGSCKIW